jgi:hypothetical protein
MVTDQQVERMRKMRMKGKTQKAAAAAAGMSERSARTWQKGQLPSDVNEPRWWRTHKDAFADVWDEVVVPLLQRDEKGELESKTIIEVLKEKFPQKFNDGHLRTLQRRVREWRALHGPEKEVMFPQEHVPGREAAVDFTHGTELGVTIRGVLFVHLLFELVLSYSGWTWICVAFGETFEALITGVQEAFWSLKGLTVVVRSDNLSAATHELPTGGRSLTKRFKAFLDHYDLKSTRIEAGEAHENGVVEQRHHRTKSAIAQALIIRGSKDFDSVEDYEAFAREAIERTHNSRIPDDRMAAERAALRPLPKHRVPTYSTYSFKVRGCSTVRVGKRTYSVPSRLIGHRVEIRQHPDVVEIRYRKKTVESMPRLRGEAHVRIDYRHVIWSLVRKPGAFARYRYREELFPTLVFRRAYDAIAARRGERADVEYVRILHLAASTLQTTVEKALAQLLESGADLDYASVKAIASPTPSAVPEIAIPAPDLAAYDRLLAGGAA